MPPIYLDYNATTPIDPLVLEAMLPYLRDHFGNPSSSHQYGQQTHTAVHKAREQVADLLGCTLDEVIFTGGGSESDNLAIKGIAEAYQDRGNHLITSQIEHPAVLNTCHYLERHGYQVTYLPVDKHGMVSPDDVEKAITPQTILITIMHANNEVGTIQPIAAISQIAHAHDILVHTDAAQSVGKISTRMQELGVDLLTVAGHKLYAPKGIGCLYVRRGIRLEPLIHGAGHEAGRRAGTENVAGMVGLGKACQIAAETLPDTIDRLTHLRDKLHTRLTEKVDGIHLNGHPTERLPNTLNLSFPGIVSNDLLAELPDIAASTGSACHSGTTEPSAVLVAMGVPRDLALGAVRFSLGKGTTEEEINRVATILSDRLNNTSAV